VLGIYATERFFHSFIHFICSTKIKTEALQIENEQDSKANIYALTAALNNARFHRFPVGQISRDFNTTTSIGDAIKTFEKEF